jgi:hypothetical protein
VITYVYSFLLVVIAMVFDIIVANWTNDENHRYNAEHEDSIVNRMFIFNLVVFYLPLGWLVFDVSNPFRYRQLADAMLSQMLFKQTAYNLQEYYTPILVTKPGLDKI